LLALGFDAMEAFNACLVGKGPNQRARLLAERAGRVAALVVAGGEGTRLGFPHPKGMFPIGPVSGKSLFQLLAEQLAARARRAGTVIPYLVMTSDATHPATVAFFEQNRYFGLDPGHVHFFRQGNMPALDKTTGRVLMQARHELALNPDGHGGVIEALARSDLLDALRDRGIEHLFYHQVDNPLVSVCDPVLLGFHARERAEATTKVVRKLAPHEKMGMVVDIDGVSQIIEYSDLAADQAARHDARGEWVFWAGNTGVHVFGVEFLARLAARRGGLPFHKAVKKVPYLSDAGLLVEPQTENAIKLERFIFDVLPLAARHLAVEALRDEEFCPLKNPSGEFGPDHVRGALSRKFAGWLRAAGCAVPDGATVEISARFAVEPGDLQGRPRLAAEATTSFFLD